MDLDEFRISDVAGTEFAQTVAEYIAIRPPAVISFQVEVHPDGQVRVAWRDRPGGFLEVSKFPADGAMASNLRGLLMLARSGEIKSLE